QIHAGLRCVGNSSGNETGGSVKLPAKRGLLSCSRLRGTSLHGGRKKLRRARWFSVAAANDRQQSARICVDLGVDSQAPSSPRHERVAEARGGLSRSASTVRQVFSSHRRQDRKCVVQGMSHDLHIAGGILSLSLAHFPIS